ncbi:dicarboxylate/amino acid:cation symporter [bacterium]|nr:dicarboxylate/amino acid:cation symporter [bacterium]
MKDKSARLTAWILIGLGAGVVVGLLQYLVLPAHVNEILIRYIHDPIGRIFLNGIRLLVVPLVLVSLTLGTAGIGDLSKLGRIGGKTVAIYLTTTAVAITIGFSLAFLVHPGANLSIPIESTFEGAEQPFIMDIFVNIVPTNPFKSMAEGSMLQIIFFAMLSGLALTAVGEKGKPIIKGLEAVDAVIQKMVEMIMMFAPIGVFGLLAKVIAGEGLAVFIPLMKYMLTIIGALLLHAFITYPSYLVAFTRLNPIQFFKNIYPAMIVAFSTSSSNATLPVTMQVAEKRLGSKESVHAFTLPLGATINMDGTAIMQGVATVFIANVYGIDLHLSQFLQVVLMATLASIGTAGVPGVGLIMLSMVLTEIGLPLEGIGIILGVDRLLDMSRTAINIAGDLMATTLVAKGEGEFDDDIYYARNRGDD